MHNCKAHKSAGYPRTVQGNGLVYLKDEKNMKKFKY